MDLADVKSMRFHGILELTNLFAVLAFAGAGAACCWSNDEVVDTGMLGRSHGASVISQTVYPAPPFFSE